MMRPVVTSTRPFDPRFRSNSSHKDIEMLLILEVSNILQDTFGSILEASDICWIISVTILKTWKINYIENAAYISIELSKKLRK